MRRSVDVGDFFPTNLSIFGYLCVSVSAIFFGYILISEPYIYSTIIKEDSYVENLTAIFFFLVGLLLVIVSTTERRTFPRCIYILGCVAFIFAAGEEVSWGQRIFDFETPGYLMNLNGQKEFNHHNIFIGQFDIAKSLRAVYLYGTFALCIITCAACFSEKRIFFMIPLPSIPLMLSFLIMFSHKSRIYTMEKELLLIFIIYILFSNKKFLSIYTIATATMILVIPYMYHYFDHTINHAEIQEFLFGLCLLFYSLELLQAQRSMNCFQNPLQTGKYKSFRIYLFYLVGISVISGSMFLGAWKYARQENIFHYRNIILQFLEDADPIIRSKFDVYLNEKSLIYVRDNCGSEDINIKFFLHIDPIQQSDLSDSHKQYGFDNLDFSFNRVPNFADGQSLKGFFDGQRCVVVRYLPSYDIAQITTGQFVEDRWIWSGTFTFK